ncbi:hypothetical protein BJY52DRAFT_1189705 [Lactarius psammicola]|nr:hypothetical protein BJY52DRAFT_1189705 [Lactarius psammicola]
MSSKQNNISSPSVSSSCRVNKILSSLLPGSLSKRTPTNESNTTLVASPAKAAEQGDTPKAAPTSPAPKRSAQKGSFWEAATVHAQYGR